MKLNYDLTPEEYLEAYKPSFPRRPETPDVNVPFMDNIPRWLGTGNDAQYFVQRRHTDRHPAS